MAFDDIDIGAFATAVAREMDYRRKECDTNGHQDPVFYRAMVVGSEGIGPVEGMCYSCNRPMYKSRVNGEKRKSARDYLEEIKVI